MSEFVFSKDYSKWASGYGERPARLYKYRSVRGAAKLFSQSLVECGEVYFAKPGELNDPFDCKPHNTIESTPGERRAFLKWMTRGREPELSRTQRRARVSELNATLKSRIKNEGFEAIAQAAFDTNLRDTGVLSLSSEPASNLMWSHYADAHRGICVEFDFQVMEKLRPMPVTYLDQRPSYNMVRNVAALSELSFLRKSLDWSYEKEWRSVGQWWSGTYRLPESAITGVILGAGISDEDRREVSNWVRKRRPTVEIRQAQFQADTYRLSFSS
jgi:hypothetical protein